jgi:hypothetical protein
MLHRTGTLAALLVAAHLLAHGAVTKIDVIKQYPVLAGASFGRTGPYECIEAKAYFAVDPKLAPNRIIADIDLASLNEQGLVEFSADLYILRPADAARGNGTALVEISNRGGKGLPYEFNLGAAGPFDPAAPESLGDGFLMEHGFTLVWIGWEFDVPDHPGLLRADLPVATDRGNVITGVVRSEWTGDHLENVISLGDRGQAGYPVLDPSSPQNKLFVRDSVLGRRTQIARSEWQFEDPTHVALKAGFAPGRIYEVVYEAKDPPVAGLGLAAVRDMTSYLKYGGQPTPLEDEHKTIKRAIAFGVSQSGRFLREFLYDGFNQDEQFRQAFDGVWAHVAGAGRGSFNLRFAQPSRDGHAFVNVFYPVDVPPFGEQQLLAKSQQQHVAPKLFLTNGSYEYWGRCASLIHTTEDGKADVAPSPASRIYFFAGSQHTVGSIPPRPEPAQNPTNTNDYRYSLRALLLAMQAWLVNGTPPPGSRFPHIAEEELTPLTSFNFPHVRGAHVSERKREAYRLDFSTEPPSAGAAFPTLVPQVDDEGNELGGIRMPEVAVPLASYTGWNLRSAAIGAPSEPVAFFGSWIPFAKTRQARAVADDPRESIEERYAGEEDYLAQIDAAARELAKAGFVLPGDLDLLHQRAASEWAYRSHLP